MAESAVLDPPQAAAPAATEPAELEWQADPNLAPPPEKAQVEPPAPAPVATSEAKAPETAPEVPEWKARLDAKDPEFLKEILGHPVLVGHIGTHADRLARQQRESAEQIARDAQLDLEAQSNPDLLSSQERLNARQGAQTQALRDAAVTDAMAPVDQWIKDTSPAAAVEEYKELVDAKKAKGEAWTLPDYVQMAVDVRLKHELTKAKATWEKEELPARFKDYLAAKGESERSPDLGSNALGAGAAGGLTDEKWQKMTPQEMAVLRSTPAGRAQIQAYWAS